jgi:hypothetical protein
VLVACVEQQRQHVGPAGSGSRRPARPNRDIQLPVSQPEQRAHDSARLLAADVLQLDQLPKEVPRHPQQPAERLAQPILSGVRGECAIDAKDPSHDHVEGHGLHSRGQRERPSDRPSVDFALGDPGDHLDVALDRLAVERRQEQLALAQVAIASQGQHGVRSEDRPQWRLARQRRGVGRFGLEQRPSAARQPAACARNGWDRPDRRERAALAVQRARLSGRSRQSRYINVP